MIDLEVFVYFYLVVNAVAVAFLVSWFLILQYDVFQILVMVAPDVLSKLILLPLVNLEFTFFIQIWLEI